MSMTNEEIREKKRSTRSNERYDQFHSKTYVCVEFKCHKTVGRINKTY